MKVSVFSKGKTPEKNEDSFDYDERCAVLADGATDKSGNKYYGKTGGELVSALVVKECLVTDLVGIELIDHLNNKIGELYKDLEILDQTKDPRYRFSCLGFVCARFTSDQLIITLLGDAGFRINGETVHWEPKEVDVINSQRRADYIRETGDIRGSREHIMSHLLKQFQYQNNEKDPLGYGGIDGTKTPAKFVKVFEYSIDEVKTLELFSDGYFDVPRDVSIDAWEALHERIEKEDPDKWKEYKSTKSKDDRTIVIIEF